MLGMPSGPGTLYSFRHLIWHLIWSLVSLCSLQIGGGVVIVLIMHIPHQFARKEYLCEHICFIAVSACYLYLSVLSLLEVGYSCLAAIACWCRDVLTGCPKVQFQSLLQPIPPVMVFVVFDCLVVFLVNFPEFSVHFVFWPVLVPPYFPT